MSVAVIILNWNGRKYLQQFLPTLLQYSKDEAEIIVADNMPQPTIPLHFLNLPILISESFRILKTEVFQGVTTLRSGRWRQITTFSLIQTLRLPKTG